MINHVVPGFEIQEPHGAAGLLDVAVRQGDRLNIVQELDKPLPDDLCEVRAQVVIDDNVVATSYAAEHLPPRNGGALILHFKFPSALRMDPQFVGVRYIGRLASDRTQWRLLEMSRPRC